MLTGHGQSCSPAYDPAPSTTAKQVGATVESASQEEGDPPRLAGVTFFRDFEQPGKSVSCFSLCNVRALQPFSVCKLLGH